MASTSKSGIKTAADGTSVIPASTRADGSTRKEIRVRPGYRPPEDVETYKNRSAEAWKTRGSGGVPGAEVSEQAKDSEEGKNKNAKRREAAKKRKETDAAGTGIEDSSLDAAMDKVDISGHAKMNSESQEPKQPADSHDSSVELDVERQKKIRNQLKKLRAVRELKEKKASGEKLSHDQVMKISKEDELLRDLKKLNYDGPELSSKPDGANITEENVG